METKNTSKFIDNLDIKIIELLTADLTKCTKDASSTAEFNDICTLKMLMYRYESSPYDKIINKLFDNYKYDKLIDETKPSCENMNNMLNFRLCQSHGGDLFAHSQWSALQIIKWFDDDDKIIDNLNLNETVLCAFFHDIGKGYDCLFNMYDSQKYDKKGDHVHPDYCGDVILGKIELQKCDGTGKKINIKEFFTTNFNHYDIKHIALTAYMHWEFGKLNIGDDEYLSFRVFGYLHTFFQTCLKLELDPTEYLLKLCIAVACADITASTNSRFTNHNFGDNITIAKQKYESFNPWEYYKMNERYNDYRNHVLNHYITAVITHKRVTELLLKSNKK